MSASIAPPHGLSRYRSRKWKCRCPVCKQANTEAQRAYRNGGQRATIEHGTRSCYNSGCKQPECVQANRDYQREWMRFHRAGIPWNEKGEEEAMLDAWDRRIGAL